MARMAEHAAFSDAVAAIDDGRHEDLTRLLTAHPELAQVRGASDRADYFAGSTLLHYVAWNPFPAGRDHGTNVETAESMPTMAPSIKALVAAGADPCARNDSGADPVSLLLTGKLASDADQTDAMLQALLDAGAKVDVSTASVHRALANHCAAGARALLSRGAPWDASAAAGLGELERLQAIVAEDHPGRRALGLAALHAYVIGQSETLDWLLGQPLDLNVTGVGNGTLLHRACAAADLPMVERLTELGADHNNRENPFWATPLDWADHGGQMEAARWVLDHATDRLDIFQASGRGLTDRVRTLLAADPEVVRACTRIWRMPDVEPLRIAACGSGLPAARLLLQHGATVNHVGGDGKTALDQAQADDHAELCDLLVQHGGRPADQL